MLIRIVEKFGEEPPVHENDGRLAWFGGPSSVGSDEEELPASALTEVVPALNVGSWYRYRDFKNLVASSQPPSADVWTTLALEEMGVQDASVLRLEVPAAHAVRTLVTAVTKHFDRFHFSDRLWVRVE